MRMFSLFQDLQLIPVQLLVHVSHPKTALSHDLNRTGHSRLLMLAQFYRAERATADFLLEDVVVSDSVNFFERLLLFKAKEVSVLRLALF